MTAFLFFALVFVINGLFESPCMAMEERPKIAFPQLILNSSDSFTKQQSPDNQLLNNSPYCPYLNTQPTESQYPPAEPEDWEYYNTNGPSGTNINSSGSPFNSSYTNFPPVPSYSPTQDRSDYNSNHYVPSQAIISPMDTNNQWQMQQYETKPDSQYIVLHREDIKKLFLAVEAIKQENGELKQMVGNLMIQGDKDNETLIVIKQGQEQMADEMRGKLEKLHNQLTNPHQSTGAKLYNWVSFLSKAGISIATSATTYAALTPILSMIAPPAIPILTGLSGLYMLAKLV